MAKSRNLHSLLDRCREFTKATDCSLFIKIIELDLKKSYVCATDDLFLEYSGRGLSMSTADSEETLEILNKETDDSFTKGSQMSASAYSDVDMMSSMYGDITGMCPVNLFKH